MYEKLDVLTTLLKKAEQLDENNLESLPDKHKNTSLDLGAVDTISYHQGYRDGIWSLKNNIKIMHDNARDEMDEETDRMYLEHLRQRCADVFAKDGEINDVDQYNIETKMVMAIPTMLKEECIRFLKDKGVWKEPKKTREQLADEIELEMLDK